MIQIAFITDENYSIPTLVALRSLIDTASKDIDYNIFVLTNNLNQNTINLFLEESKDNININIINGEDYIKDFNYEHLYVSNTALLKFYLPLVLKDIEKVLYLDCDILINKDVAQIYEIDINEKYAGVTLDMVCMHNNENQRINHEYYFNSGVMLLNLNKMREDNITQKLIEYKKEDKYKLFMDQDSFNVCFDEKIKLLPAIYNLLSEYYNYFSNKQIEEYYKCVINEESAVVYHFAGRSKPWSNPSFDNFKNWSKYLKNNQEYMFLVQQIYKELKNDSNTKSKEIEKIYNFQENNRVEIHKILDGHNERIDNIYNLQENNRAEIHKILDCHLIQIENILNKLNDIEKIIKANSDK